MPPGALENLCTPVLGISPLFTRFFKSSLPLWDRTLSEIVVYFMGQNPSQTQTFPNYLLTVDKTQVLQGAARFTANHPVIGKTRNELTQKMWLKSFSTPPHISGGHKTHYERRKPAACWSLGHAGHGTQPSGREDVCSAPHHCPGCNSHLFCSSQ